MITIALTAYTTGVSSAILVVLGLIEYHERPDLQTRIRRILWGIR